MAGVVGDAGEEDRAGVVMLAVPGEIAPEDDLL
jgi:hypothetical protein